MSQTMLDRRSFGAATLCAMLPGMARTQAVAAAFPSRAVRLVVPTPPGSAPDIRGRQLAQKLSDEWQQPVIVDNRPGASERLAMDAALQSPPDGYTLMLGLNAMTISPHLVKLPFDPLREFAAVTRVSSGPLILLTSPGAAIGSIAELVAYAGVNPGKLNAAHPGVGTLPHLAFALFGKTAGIDMLNVPYGGGGGAKMAADLIAGQVQLAFNVASPVLTHLKSGRMRALAVASPSRLAILPEVPTFAELGFPAMNVMGWGGVFVRTGTPQELIDTLNKTLVKVLEHPDIRQSMLETGEVAGGDSPDQFRAFILSEHARWGKVIADAGIRLE